MPDTILLIDNYDSFAHNLARYFVRLGMRIVVRRNDEVSVDDIPLLRPAAIVLSPGPCTPDTAGCCVDVVREFGSRCPILGVCLGHQAIAVAFGATVVRAPVPMHGRTSEVLHDGQGVFLDVPSPFVACRYHSLVVDRATIADEFIVNGVTHDGVVMAMQHRNLPLVGLQFHPEAILTEYGYPMLANFLRMARLPVPARLPDRSDELLPHPTKSPPLPNVPVTF